MTENIDMKKENSNKERRLLCKKYQNKKKRKKITKIEEAIAKENSLNTIISPTLEACLLIKS